LELGEGTGERGNEKDPTGASKGRVDKKPEVISSNREEVRSGGERKRNKKNLMDHLEERGKSGEGKSRKKRVKRGISR